MMEQHAFPVIDLRATGANILRLRKERGLTVRDLQAYFGFEAPQAIYRWQSGVSLPTVDNLYALSILLNVTMEDILIVRNRSVCEQQAELDCSVFFSGNSQVFLEKQSFKPPRSGPRLKRLFLKTHVFRSKTV